MRRNLSYLLILACGCGSALPKARILQFEGFGESNDGAARLAEAERELEAGRIDAALARAAALRMEFPNNFFVHCLYQEAMIAAKREEEVFEEYKHLCDSAPSAFYYTMFARLQKTPEAGISQTIRALDLDDKFPWAWYARGWWIARGETGRRNAEQLFRYALELHPNFFLAMRSYAVVLKETDPSAALEMIRKYTKAFPAQRDKRVFLVSLLLDLKMYEEAVLEFRALLQEKPGDAEAERLLPLALLPLNQVAEAKKILLRLAREHPEDPTYDFNLAVVAEVYENDFETAKEYYKRYLDRDDGKQGFYRARARIYLQELEAKTASAASTPAASPTR